MYTKETLQRLEDTCSALEVYLDDIKKRVKILRNSGYMSAIVRESHEKLLSQTHTCFVSLISRDSSSFELLHDDDNVALKVGKAISDLPAVSPLPYPEPSTGTGSVDQQVEVAKDNLRRQVMQEQPLKILYGDIVQENGVHASVNRAIQNTTFIENKCAQIFTSQDTVLKAITDTSLIDNGHYEYKFEGTKPDPTDIATLYAHMCYRGSLEDLKKLVDHNQANPILKSIYGGVGGNTWNSVLYSSGHHNAKAVSIAFMAGLILQYGKTNRINPLPIKYDLDAARNGTIQPLYLSERSSDDQLNAAEIIEKIKSEFMVYGNTSHEDFETTINSAINLAGSTFFCFETQSIFREYRKTKSIPLGLVKNILLSVGLYLAPRPALSSTERVRMIEDVAINLAALDTLVRTFTLTNSAGSTTLFGTYSAIAARGSRIERTSLVGKFTKIAAAVLWEFNENITEARNLSTLVDANNFFHSAMYAEGFDKFLESVVAQVFAE